MYEYPVSDTDLTALSAWAISIHLLMLTLVMTPVALLLVRSRHPVRRGDGLAFLLAFVLGLISLAVVQPLLSETARPFITGYLLFFNVIVGLGFLTNLVRLRRQGTRLGAWRVLGVLLLLGCLIALLLPAVPSAREAARRMSCSNNLKQIALAIHNYAAEHDQQVFGTAAASDSGVPLSWRVRLLPYLEQQPLYERYDTSHPWDSLENRPIRQTWVPAYLCPSRARQEDPTGDAFTSYAAVVGHPAFFHREQPTAFAQRVTESPSQLMVVEACGRNIIWTEPRDVDPSELAAGVNLPGEVPGFSNGILSSHHTSGAQAATADGSVRFIRESIDPRVLEQLVQGTPVDFDAN